MDIYCIRDYNTGVCTKMDIKIGAFVFMMAVVIFVPFISNSIADVLDMEKESDASLPSGFQDFIDYVEDLPLIGDLVQFLMNILVYRIQDFASYFPEQTANLIQLFFGVVNVMMIIGVAVLGRRVVGLS